MSKTKIVLIEDDEILSKVLYVELTDVGFEVTRAYDGETGLEMVRSQKPDLVLLDLVLPKKHGFEVLGDLKKAPDMRDIPVVILTMLGADDDIKKGLSLGANDYIVKSQHAVTEIIGKVKGFFAKEYHPEAKQMRSEKRDAAASQDIAQFIKELRSAGVADEEIKKKLSEAGWADTAIENAFKE